jgi:hypothetical protein
MFPQRFSNFIRIFSLFIGVSGIAGCQEDQGLALTGTISIPYMSECKETVGRAQHYYKNSFRSEKGYVDLNVETFDKTFLTDFGVDGLVRISVYGNLNLLNGLTSEYYVKGIADSISAECLPDVYVSFKSDKLSNMFMDIKKEYGSPVVTKVVDGRSYIYFNKKDTKIDYWSNY